MTDLDRDDCVGLLCLWHDNGIGAARIRTLVATLCEQDLDRLL